MLLIASCLIPNSVFGHHSRASYDKSKEVVFKGEIVEVRWKNPHILMTVQAEDDEGEIYQQEIELMSVSEAG